MKILFFNLYHIGDTFFPFPSIKAICDANPSKTFYLAQLCNYDLYRSIPNLVIISKEQDHGNQDHLIERLLNIPDSTQLIVTVDDYVCVNTRCVAIEKITCQRIECNFIKFFQHMGYVVDILNNSILHDCCIRFPYELANIQKLPEIKNPVLEHRFLQWKQGRKCVFYYNYYPKSTQEVPLPNPEDHAHVIMALSQKLKNCMIIIPRFDVPTTLKDGTRVFPENVVSCEEVFGIQEDVSCANITQLTVISDMCEVSVYHIIGACMYYMNRRICNVPSSSHKIIVMTDAWHYFPDTSKETVEGICGTSEHIEKLICTDTNDVITKLPTRVLYKI